jgi:hypothetical protein
MKFRSLVRAGAGLALLATTAPLVAQGPGGRGGARPLQKAPLATPISADSLPAYVRADAPTDATIRRIW